MSASLSHLGRANSSALLQIELQDVSSDHHLNLSGCHSVMQHVRRCTQLAAQPLDTDGKSRAPSLSLLSKRRNPYINRLNPLLICRATHSHNGHAP